jgi:Rps23 Pro-64 3,4-dihydroxylase Tpa1-like proline 4-hydroxylase
MDFSFRLGDLLARVEADAQNYCAARPFPHITIDNFLLPEVLENAMREFPTPDAIANWRRPNDLDEQGRVAAVLKLGYSNELEFGPTLRRLIHELNSAPFLRYISALTGIEHLIPDPHMIGAGLHQYLPGSILRIHADFNRLPGTMLDRRLNLLIYLNPDWDAAWGGALELWDSSMEHCEVRVQPVANRCVIFSTTSTSYHGMPEPLACPTGVTRRSVALYYYSNGRPEHEAVPDHSTLWQARPHER